MPVWKDGEFADAMMEAAMPDFESAGAVFLYGIALGTVLILVLR
jgi:hypothetical protein